MFKFKLTLNVAMAENVLVVFEGFLHVVNSR